MVHSDSSSQYFFSLQKQHPYGSPSHGIGNGIGGANASSPTLAPSNSQILNGLQAINSEVSDQLQKMR